MSDLSTQEASAPVVGVVVPAGGRCRDEHATPPPDITAFEMRVFLDWLDQRRGRAQPTPLPRGHAVVPRLLALLDAAGHTEAAALVRERAAVGLARYGQPLMTEDGRDTMRDAVEELGDLLLYAHSARMQGLDLAPLRALLPALMEVLG